MSDLLGQIKKIAPEIFKNRHIHAMWLEGSYATGRFNQQSDIDVWLDVDDDTFEYCAKVFKRHLEKLGKVDYEEARGVYSTDPRLAKYVFHLKGFPEEQTIELDMQEHSRNFVFSKSIHTIEVLFDKDNTVQWKD